MELYRLCGLSRLYYGSHGTRSWKRSSSAGEGCVGSAPASAKMAVLPSRTKEFGSLAVTRTFILAALLYFYSPSVVSMLVSSSFGLKSRGFAAKRGQNMPKNGSQRFGAHLQQFPRAFHAALGPFAGQPIEFGASKGAVNEPQPQEKDEFTIVYQVFS